MASTKKFLQINSDDGSMKCCHCGELNVWQTGATVSTVHESVNINFTCNPCKRDSTLQIYTYKGLTYFEWSKN